LEESSEVVQPVEAPVAQPVVAPVASAPQEPLVTVVETQPVPIRKHVTQKHNAYDYVKK
jgi:hypothetical protein